MKVCPTHNRWTYIETADGGVSRRDCPECPSERAKNLEMHNRIGEVFGELAWQAQTIFAEQDDGAFSVKV